MMAWTESERGEINKMKDELSEIRADVAELKGSVKFLVQAEVSRQQNSSSLENHTEVNVGNKTSTARIGEKAAVGVAGAIGVLAGSIFTALAKILGWG